MGTSTWQIFKEEQKRKKKKWYYNYQKQKQKNSDTRTFAIYIQLPYTPIHYQLVILVIKWLCCQVEYGY